MNSSIFIKKEDIKPKLEVEDFSSNLIAQNLSGLEGDISTFDSDDNVSLVNIIFFYMFIFILTNY